MDRLSSSHPRAMHLVLWEERGGKGRGQGLDDGSVELITAKSHALGPEMGEGRRRMVSETIVDDRHTQGPCRGETATPPSIGLEMFSYHKKTIQTYLHIADSLTASRRIPSRDRCRGEPAPPAVVASATPPPPPPPPPLGGPIIASC